MLVECRTLVSALLKKARADAELCFELGTDTNPELWMKFLSTNNDMLFLARGIREYEELFQDGYKREFMATWNRLVVEEAAQKAEEVQDASQQQV